MEIMQGWVIMACQSERGAATPHGYFKEFSHACLEAKGIAYYDSDGRVDPQKFLMINETEGYPISESISHIYTSPKNEEEYKQYMERKRILDKMTDEDLDVLGINREEFLK